MSDNINFDYKNLSPFKWFVLENFPFIEADFDALSEWQLFCKIGKEINKIINSQNIVGEQAETLTNAFNTLYNYVHDYFDNLDVQDEINNKLNEMVEDGTLQQILNNYANITRVYNTYQEMIADTTLVNNQKVKTLGYYNINDGGNAEYYITNDTNTNLYQVQTAVENLYARLINKEIYVEQFGAKGDGIQDDTTYIQNAINYCIENKLVLKSKGGKTFLISSSLNLNNRIDIDFNNSTIITNENIDMIKINYNTGTRNENQGYLKNITIDMNNIASHGIYIIRGVKKLLSEITIKNISTIAYEIDDGYEIIFQNSHFYGSSNLSVGLKLNDSDCHYKDIIMIDVHNAIYSNATNFFARIHAWMLTKELIPGSIFLKSDTGSSQFLNQCYSDTFNYGFYINNEARLRLTEHYNYYNGNIMSDDVILNCGGQIYLFYYAQASYSQRTAITNSNLYGLTRDSSKSYFSNINPNELLLWKDANSYIASWQNQIKTNQLIPTLNTTQFTLNSNYLNRILKSGYNVNLNMRLENTAYLEENQTLQIGQLPNGFRPDTECNFLAPYTTGANYNTFNGYVLVNITNSGNITIYTKDVLNTNARILINKSFIGSSLNS